MKKLDPVDQEYTYAQTPDGQVVLIGVRQDLPITLPNGDRSYVRRTTLVPDATGRLINPEDANLVTCQACGAFPIHHNATRTCANCSATTCRTCSAPIPIAEGAEPQYICRNCAQTARRRGLVRFFLSFQ